MEDHYARKRGFPTIIGLFVLGAIISILWFLIGTGQQSERAKEAELIEAQLPTIWLVYKDDVYKGEELSYCWFGRCSNNDINFTNHVIIKQGSDIGFVVNAIIDQTSMDIFIHNSIIYSDGSVSILNRLDRELESIGESTYKIDLDPGTYVIIVHATWEDRGYVEYAFSIKVV